MKQFLFVMALAWMTGAGVSAQQLPYQNPNLGAKERCQEHHDGVK